MKKSYLLGAIIILLVVLLFLIFSRSNTSHLVLDNFEGEVKLYKSLACGCCEIHSKYLSSKGSLDVEKINVQDISVIKRQYDIPQGLESCHTAIIDGYFIEGHVPLEAIGKLLEEKPDIAGIALPGMPSGSPGMPGVKYTDFVIYAVNHDRSYYEFMRI